MIATDAPAFALISGLRSIFRSTQDKSTWGMCSRCSNIWQLPGPNQGHRAFVHACGCAPAGSFGTEHADFGNLSGHRTTSLVG